MYFEWKFISNGSVMPISKFHPWISEIRFIEQISVYIMIKYIDNIAVELTVSWWAGKDCQCVSQNFVHPIWLGIFSSSFFPAS